MTAEQYEAIKEKAEPRDKPFNCLVLDDVGNTIRDNKKLETLFNTLVLNRAHKGVCGTFIIILLQNFKQIGPRIRSNMSHVLSLLPSSKEEMEYLFEFTSLPKNEMHDVYNHAFQKPRDTLFIVKFPKDSCQPVLYHNFDKMEQI